MKRDLEATSSVASLAQPVELSLVAIEASATFRASPRHRALLRYLVERVLDGDLTALKETMIALAVFGRSAAHFDPKLDSIVRVEARRLRRRLALYYAREGRDAALRIELPIGSYMPLVRERSHEPARAEASRRARDLVERGEHFLRQALSKQTLETALARFDEALRVTPALAAAHVGIGRAWLNLATGWHHPPRVAADHAAEALRRAIDLEPGDAVAHALLGAIQSQFERNWSAAQRSFRRAVALAPEQAFVHSAYGAHLYMHSHFDRAEQELLLARELDPQYVNSRAHLVNVRIAQGRLDDARAELDAMLDIAPDSLAANGLAGVIAMARGDAHGAAAIYDRLCVIAPENPGCFASLAGAQGAMGRLDLAEATLAAMSARFDQSLVSPYVLALAATHAGRSNDAFALLERADAERDPSALQIPFDVSFWPLHPDPRWPTLIEKVCATSAGVSAGPSRPAPSASSPTTRAPAPARPRPARR